MSTVVMWLHSDQPTNGRILQCRLEAPQSKVFDRSFADPRGTLNVLGTGRCIAHAVAGQSESAP